MARPVVVDGFRSFAAGGCYLLVAEQLETSVGALDLLEPGGLERALAHRSGFRGRGETSVVPLAGRSERLHLRPFQHGGWLGGLRGNKLLGLGRPIDELRITAALVAAGVSVPTPALVVAVRSGPRWRAAFGTLFEEKAIDGTAWLSSAPDRSRLVRAATATATAVRSFHDAGARHNDLHLGNLLIKERAGRTEVVIVDLDRSKLGGPLTLAQRTRDLMRLHRSLVKRSLVERVGRRSYARFLEAYTEGDRDLRRALLAQLSGERIRLALHAAGYWSAERFEATRRLMQGS